MCLIVGTKKLVAKTDLLVYKCLDKEGRKFCTPFRYLPIKFTNGRCVIESAETALTIEKEWHEKKLVKVINIGVHAYTDKDISDDIAERFPECGTKTYYTVIPKGCPYYVGMKFDVVSTKMIVFKSKEDFDKYAEGKEIKEI